MIGIASRYSKYKQVDLPWLSEIPSHWESRRAKWLFTKMDRPAKESDDVVTCFRDGIVTLRKNRRLSGFTESLKEIGYQGIRKGDLVIHAMDAFAGAVGVSDSDGKGTPVYSVCKPSSDANPYYYAYVIREMARNQWILALSKGIRERSTDFRFVDFANQYLPLPPLEEQNAIVRYLNHMDNLIKRYIRAKQKEIQLLNEKKLVIIHDLITQGMDPSARKKESGIEWLSKIPEHWTVKPLKRWVSINNKSLSNLTKKDFTFDYYDIGTISTGYRVHQPVRVTFEQSPSRARRIVNNGDTIISTVRTYLKTVFFFETIDFPTIVSTGFAVLTPSYELIPEYLGYVIQEHVFIEQVTAYSCGVDYPAINQTKLSNIKIAVPTKQEQIRIVDEIREKSRPIDDQIKYITQEIAFLNEYYKRLVSDVVTGKMNVGEIDQTRINVETFQYEPFMEFDDDSVLDEEGQE